MVQRWIASCALAGAVALVLLEGACVDAARVKVKKAKAKKNLLRSGIAAGLGEQQLFQTGSSVSVKDGFSTSGGNELALSGAAAEGLKMGTLPPEFWMWNTTPAPPTPPGPYPQVMWVPVPAPPVPTIPPTVEQCYGCDCLFVFADKLVKGGTVANEFTCIGGKASIDVPEMRWAGTPVNSGVGHPIKNDDGTSKCAKSMSMAVVVEDMDYPNGVGEGNNRMHVQFWAANIPQNWKEFTFANSREMYKGQQVVHLGKNDAGTRGMEPICPAKGTHRYRFTLFSLRDYVSSGDEPLDPDTTFQDILPTLQKLELQRATFYGNVKADPAFFPDKGL